VPSLFATCVFFVQLFAGFWKTLYNLEDVYDSKSPESRGLNRSPHNLAFGTLFFWLPFAVLATAFVGGAQTENSVRRILERLRIDVQNLQADENSRRSSPGPQPPSEAVQSSSSSELSVRDGIPSHSRANGYLGSGDTIEPITSNGRPPAAHERLSNTRIVDPPTAALNNNHSGQRRS
jgi:hypothetical protein